MVIGQNDQYHCIKIKELGYLRWRQHQHIVKGENRVVVCRPPTTRSVMDMQLCCPVP